MDFYNILPNPYTDFGIKNVDSNQEVLILVNGEHFKNIHSRWALLLSHFFIENG